MLESIIKDDNRLILKDIPIEYKTDIYVKNAIEPIAVALPKHTNEVSKLMEYAYNNDIKVIVRGANTGAVGSQVVIDENTLVIDLKLMNNILELDEETMTLVVEPGVLLDSVQKYVEQKGYFYPPDPGSKMSSIGGNVSTNAGGMRALKYGTTRNYVKELEVVLPDGKIVQLGSLNIKDSSGYDLKDLFIGSEGTLGVVTKVKLKIIQKPKYDKSVILAFKNVNVATNSVIEILKNGYSPTPLEMFERKTIQYSEDFLNKKFPSQKGNAYILMTLDGNDEEKINKQIKEILQLIKSNLVESIILDEKSSQLSWNLRDSILYALMELTKFEMLDEVVPINKFAEMIKHTKELGETHKINVLNFGHAGDGNIHTIILQEDYSDDEWIVKRKLYLDDLYSKVKKLGGLISAEHGVGYTKKGYFLKMTDPNKVEIMRAIKKAIDPKNILNPNKIF